MAVYYKVKIKLNNELFYTNKHDGRVFIMQCSKRITIGKLCSDDSDSFHPSDGYFSLFPNEVDKYDVNVIDYNHKVINAGLFAAMLAVGYITNVYPLLVTVLGCKFANMLMDFAAYQILNKSNVSMLFSSKMADQMLFSMNNYGSSAWSELFNNEALHASLPTLKDALLIQYIKTSNESHRKVWIAIDSSNSDSQCTNSELASRGHAKSLKNTDIISYMYAVDAETGIPITYEVYQGGVADCKAIIAFVNHLRSSDIDVQGVILDRGFCTSSVEAELRKHNLPFVMMLKSNCIGSKKAIELFIDDVIFNPEKLVSNTGVFGTTTNQKIFNNSTEESVIGVYHDPINGSQRAVEYLNKVYAEVERINKELDSGNSEVVINSEFKNFIKIIENDGVKTAYLSDENGELKTALERKGSYSIASSHITSSEDIFDVYNLRDSNEKGFSTLKTHLGSRVFRCHSDKSIEVKAAIAFIAYYYRQHFANYCQGKNLNKAITDLNQLSIQNFAKSAIEFHLSDYTKGDADSLLSSLGVNQQERLEIAEMYSKAMLKVKPSQTIRPPFSSFIEHLSDEAKELLHIPTNSEEAPQKPVEPKVKGKPGRPKGSLNKKTIAAMEAKAKAEQEAIARGEPLPVVEKRKPGRPKGSLNKKTIAAMEAKAKAEQEAIARGEPLPVVEKRKPGRPKGSLNKRTIAAMEAKAKAEQEAIARGEPLPVVEKPKMGRPKGSLNKKTIAAMEAKAKAEQEAIARGEPLPVVEKRKPGRPKGSLNKSTIAAMEAKAKADQETSVVQSGAAESEANPSTGSTDLKSFSCNTDFGYDDSQNNSLCKQDCASSMLSSNTDLASDFNTGFDLNSYWFN